MNDAIILVHNDDVSASKLDGGTFQVHVVTSGVLKFYPVKIAPIETRCPVIVAGDQCGRNFGHVGPHQWGNGD